MGRGSCHRGVYHAPHCASGPQGHPLLSCGAVGAPTSTTCGPSGVRHTCSRRKSSAVSLTTAAKKHVFWGTSPIARPTDCCVTARSSLVGMWSSKRPPLVLQGRPRIHRRPDRPHRTRAGKARPAMPQTMTTRRQLSRRRRTASRRTPPRRWCTPSRRPWRGRRTCRPQLTTHRCHSPWIDNPVGAGMVAHQGSNPDKNDAGPSQESP